MGTLLSFVVLCVTIISINIFGLEEDLTDTDTTLTLTFALPTLVIGLALGSTQIWLSRPGREESFTLMGELARTITRCPRHPPPKVSAVRP